MRFPDTMAWLWAKMPFPPALFDDVVRDDHATGHQDAGTDVSDDVSTNNVVVRGRVHRVLHLHGGREIAVPDLVVDDLAIA